MATHLRNAHVSRLAREAVDVAGLGVVLLDSQGRIAWRSPQAMHWLEEALGPQDDATPLKGWLQAAITQGDVNPAAQRQPVAGPIPRADRSGQRP